MVYQKRYIYMLLLHNIMSIDDTVSSAINLNNLDQ